MIKQRNHSSKKGTRYFCVLIVTVLITAVLYGFRISPADAVLFNTAYATEAYGAEFVEEIIESGPQLLLTSDKTNFKTGENATVTFTVELPLDTQEGTIVIYDGDGRELLVIEPEEAEHNKIESSEIELNEIESEQIESEESETENPEPQAEDNGLKAFRGLLEVDTGMPGIIVCRAQLGDLVSNELNLYITPQISRSNIDECDEVITDLWEVLSGLPEDNAMEAALEFVSNDARIDEVYQESESMLWFTTNDGIISFYDDRDYDDKFGAVSESDTSFGEYDDVTAAYTDFLNNGTTRQPDGSVTYLNSGNAWSNSNVIVLRPLYYSDWLCGIDYHYNRGVELANALNGTCYDAVGLNALISIVNGSLSEYGTVILNTHGVNITGKDGKTIKYAFQMSKNTDENTFSEVWEIIERNVKANGETEFDKFYGSLSDVKGVNIRMAWGLGKKGSRNLIMTGDYIMDRYQNLSFDNTVIYFGTCWSAQHDELIEFFLDRGAQCYFGYMTAVDPDVEKHTFTEFMDTMIPLGDRASTVNDVFEYTYISAGTYAAHGAMRAFKSFTQTLSNLITLKPAWGDQRFFGFANPDFTYGDTGTLRGRIVDEHGQPVENALITVWRFENQGFSEKAEVENDEDGGFEINDLPYGAYCLNVSGQNFQDFNVSYVLKSDLADGGDIIVEPLNWAKIYLQVLNESSESKVSHIALNDLTGDNIPEMIAYFSTETFNDIQTRIWTTDGDNNFLLFESSARSGSPAKGFKDKEVYFVDGYPGAGFRFTSMLTFPDTPDKESFPGLKEKLSSEMVLMQAYTPDAHFSVYENDVTESLYQTYLDYYERVATKYNWLSCADRQIKSMTDKEFQDLYEPAKTAMSLPLSVEAARYLADDYFARNNPGIFTHEPAETPESIQLTMRSVTSGSANVLVGMMTIDRMTGEAAIEYNGNARQDVSLIR